MNDQIVKGELFNSVLDQVARRWGSTGLEEARVRPGDYRDGEWYDFSEFCRLLDEIRSVLGNNNPLTVYQLGFSTIKEDGRWKEVFEDLDPAEVFLTSERQVAQYKVGTLSAVAVGPKHVRLDYVTGETCSVWYDFYRGQLQAVLELTGRAGVVHLLPAKGSGKREYDVKWG